ncbi:MAG: ROK family protein [Chloroflexi bacterium]|nr:MAG: ROK family protein [Chloroflexota bacterium]
MPLYGAIEAGGTKFVCAVGTGPDNLHNEIRFPTTTPQETIGRAIAYFKEQAAQSPLAAIGVAAFGPVDPNPASDTFGYITTTPKPGWANTDFGQAVSRALGVPVGFDTDVNGAALGEHRWGAAQGLDNFIYLTIGTGIGGGGLVNGHLMHGLIHPEMGHILLPPHPDDPHPEGFCPYHGHCLEGMANGPALEKRWGHRAETLAPDHPAWELEAHYLAVGLAGLICTLSPERIILGGGVMEQAHLFPLVRQKVQQQLNGYVQSPAILDKIDQYIVPPGLGNRAGILGAIALAEQQLGE